MIDVIKCNPRLSTRYSVAAGPSHPTSQPIHYPALLEEHFTPPLSQSSDTSSPSSSLANGLPSYTLRKQKQPKETAHIHPSLHSNLGDSALHSHRGVKWTLQLAPESLFSICARELYPPLYKDIALSAGPCLLGHSHHHTNLYLTVKSYLNSLFLFFWPCIPSSSGPISLIIFTVQFLRRVLDVSLDTFSLKNGINSKNQTERGAGDYKKYRGFQLSAGRRQRCNFLQSSRIWVHLTPAASTTPPKNNNNNKNDHGRLKKNQTELLGVKNISSEI